MEKEIQNSEDDFFKFLSEEIDTFEKTYKELSKKGNKTFNLRFNWLILFS